MSTIYDNFIAVTAAWEIDQRITYHMADGRMLQGLKYDSEGTFKVDGEDTLPLLQPWSVLLNEEIGPGAPRTGANGVATKNATVSETLTLSYRVATSRKYGWFRRDPTDTSVPKGFMEWIALIRDAMETTADGLDNPDAALNLGLLKPVKFAIRESETSQLSYQCLLEVELFLPHYCRTERSSPLVSKLP